MTRWLFCLALLWSLAAPARAWTRAQVRDAKVELALRADGRVQVALDLGVEVQGGRLERLELSGFEDGMAVTASVPAWFEGPDGTRGAPSVAASAGKVEVAFARGERLRPGHYRVGFTYDAPAQRTLSWAGEVSQVSWTLPGWEAGLDRAEVTWLAPAGTTLVDTPDVLESATMEERGQWRALHVVREQIPRTTAWELSVRVPPEQSAAPAMAASTGAASQPAGSSFAWACLVVWLAAVAGRVHVARRARESGLVAESSWGPSWAVGGLASLLACVAWGLRDFSLGGALLALIALGLVAAPSVRVGGGAQGLGHFESIPRIELSRARKQAMRERIGRGFWVDAGTWSGAAGAVGLVGVGVAYGGLMDGVVRAWALALSCALVSLLTSGRFRRPRTVSERLQVLHHAAQGSTLSGYAARLVWFVSPARPAAEPRLRITLASRHHGLLRVELVADSRRGEAPLALVVVAIRDSGVDRALSVAWGERARELSRGGERVAFVSPVESLDEGLSALMRLLSEDAQRSVIAMLEPTQRAA